MSDSGRILNACESKPREPLGWRGFFDIMVDMESIAGKEKLPPELVFESGEMKVEYSVLPFGSKAVEIRHPDEDMFLVVNRIMHDNFTGSEAYNVNKACGVFWQVGHEPDTDYIQLEFWKSEEAAHQAFISLLTQRYTKEKSTEKDL